MGKRIQLANIFHEKIIKQEAGTTPKMQLTIKGPEQVILSTSSIEMHYYIAQNDDAPQGKF